MRMNQVVFPVVRAGIACLFGGAILLGGCASSPKPVSAAPSRALSPRDRVQVWSGRGSQVLHAVRFTDASVSGVPYLQPPECDSCRVSLTLSAVDSMKTVPGEGNAIAGVLAPVAVLVGVIVAWRIADDD